MSDSGFTERFWAMVVRGEADECWLWLGTLTPNGYGQLSRDGRMHGAHRLSYELNIGPIPEGLHIDHLCRNRACVNPTHLEPVTCRENLLRGEGFAAKQAQQTHCLRGHLLEGDNLYINPRGNRECKACRNLARRAYRKRLATA